METLESVRLATRSSIWLVSIFTMGGLVKNFSGNTRI